MGFKQHEPILNYKEGIWGRKATSLVKQNRGQIQENRFFNIRAQRDRSTTQAFVN